MVTTKKCTKERKLSEKLKWSHRDLEQKRQMLIKEYEEYRKKLSYLETEINIRGMKSESNSVLDLTMGD